MFTRTEIRGMDAVALRRSSSAGQGTSINNQGRTIDSVIVQYTLNVIHEFKLEAVTGSIPGNRTDIDEVIDIRNKNGIKQLLLLVPDHTRFTRAGAGHGGSLLYKLRTNGVLVYFVAEDLLVENDLSLQMALMLLAAAHQTAKSIARSSTIGGDASFLAGKSPYTRVPPFGLDRMYFVDGKPAHIIRNLPDGTQEMIDPRTQEVIRRFDPNPPKGVPAHYIKQKNETVALCAGAPSALAKLFMLFEMRYVQHLKYRRIAVRMNDAGITGPMGGLWSGPTVRSLLLNPIYIGLAIRYRTTGGVYVQGGSQNGEPEPSEVTPEELDQNATIKVRRRDRSKWRQLPAPDFSDFLPEAIRDAARAASSHHLDRIADGKPLKKYSRDPHINSLYILKNILHCKKTGLPMTGRLSGRNNDVRTYAVGKGSNIARDGISTKRIRAVPIETAVMEIVRGVVLNRPGLVAAMEAVVTRADRQKVSEPNDVDLMQRQIRKLKKQIVVLSDQVNDEDEDQAEIDPIVGKINSLKQEIKRLEHSIRKAGVAPVKPQNRQGAIQRLADDLAEWGRKIDPGDSAITQAILELLVERIDVDRDTKEFEITLAVPSWLPEALDGSRPMGLESWAACRPLHEAHPKNGEILGVFNCDALGKPICYTCQRRAA